MTETKDTSQDTPRAVAELRPERLGQRDLGETELRTVFHLVVRQDEEPRFEVHAEVQALLGAR